MVKNTFLFFLMLDLLRSMTIDIAIEKFKRRLIVMQRPATMQYYEFYFKLMQRYLQQTMLSEIDEDRILLFMIEVKKHHPKMKNITVNKLLSALKTTIKVATGKVITFTRLAEAKKVIPIIPQPTIRSVFSYFNPQRNHFQLRNYLIIKLFYETGLRMSELIHLKKTAIDFTHHTIQVNITKTHDHRVVFFRQETKVLLHQWITLHHDIPYVFYNLRTGEKMTTSAIESMIYQLKKTKGIHDNITPHKWRHTFATEFLRKGGDLETLRMILGHRNLKTTQKYLHLTEHDIRLTYQKIMDQD